MSKKTVAFTAIFAGSTGVFVGVLGTFVALASNKRVSQVIADELAVSLVKTIYGEEKTHRSAEHVNYRGGYIARRSYNPSSKTGRDIQPIVVGTRAEAEEVLDQLETQIRQYGSATMADFYELVGIKSGFADSKWGWTDLEGSTVFRHREGWAISLPPFSPLD